MNLLKNGMKIQSVDGLMHHRGATRTACTEAGEVLWQGRLSRRCPLHRAVSFPFRVIQWKKIQAPFADPLLLLPPDKSLLHPISSYDTPKAKLRSSFSAAAASGREV